MGLRCISDRVWDCSWPSHLRKAPENGLVVRLLDWKMNVQSPSTSDRKLFPPTDVAYNTADAHFILGPRVSCGDVFTA